MCANQASFLPHWRQSYLFPIHMPAKTEVNVRGKALCLPTDS